jgi:hypothetical protein
MQSLMNSIAKVNQWSKLAGFRKETEDTHDDKQGKNC